MMDGVNEVNGGVDRWKWPFHEQTVLLKEKNRAPNFCHMHIFPSLHNLDFTLKSVFQSASIFMHLGVKCNRV